MAPARRNAAAAFAGTFSGLLRGSAEIDGLVNAQRNIRESFVPKEINVSFFFVLFFQHILSVPFRNDIPAKATEGA